MKEKLKSRINSLDSKYHRNGIFEFKSKDNLREVNNAPDKGSGIYIIYNQFERIDSLIYIGISGSEKDGQIVHRKDGIGGRITKGKQFGDARRNSWSKKMNEDNISKILLHWYITFDNNSFDYPRPLEKELLELYLQEFKQLPLWNKKI